MSELTEFLLARIAEDETVAKAAIEDDGGETGGMEDSFDQLTGRADWFGAPVLPKYGDPLARLIVHTAVPARVLRECEAKRRIVDQLQRHERLVDANHEKQTEASFGGIKNQEQISALRTHGWELHGRLEALKMATESHAAVYADHPDYRDEWRVEP